MPFFRPSPQPPDLAAQASFGGYTLVVNALELVPPWCLDSQGKGRQSLSASRW